MHPGRGGRYDTRKLLKRLCADVQSHARKDDGAKAAALLAAYAAVVAEDLCRAPLG